MDTDQVSDLIRVLKTATTEISAEIETSQSQLNALSGLWRSASSAAFAEMLGQSMGRLVTLRKAGQVLADRLAYELAEWEDATRTLSGPVSAGQFPSGSSAVSEPPLGIFLAWWMLDQKQNVVNSAPLFSKGEGDVSAIQSSDVSQGKMGDCYFLASLAAIADRDPQLIRDAIRDNGDGTYTVRLYSMKDGVMTPEYVTVDSELLKFVDDQKYPSGQDNIGAKVGGDKWVAIFEKAYAAQHGSYANIGNGGWMRDALSALTGNPSESYTPDKISLNQLASMQKDGYALTVGTKDGKSILSPELVGPHAYFIKSVDTVSGQVVLGNPWGPQYDVTMSFEDLKKDVQVFEVNSLNK